MDNSVYIALSRQLALFRDMASTAQNIANVGTVGYNSSHIVFSDYLVPDGKKNRMAFADDTAMYRDTAPGSLSTTYNPLDVALQGQGYFMVETPLGTRYTRGGNFSIDGSGTLITPDGYPILDQNNQHIQFSQDDREIKIGEDGAVFVNGEERGFLGVVAFENPQMLERVGARLYKTDAEPKTAEGVKVAQGTLENSNVQPVVEMVHMMDISRAVTGTSKFIEVMYDLQRRTNSTWAGQAQ